MPKKQRQFGFFILGGYLLGVLATLVLRGNLVFFKNWLEMVGLGLGGILGWEIVWFDKIAYVFILHPETQIAQYVKYHISRKNYKAALALLTERQVDKLTTRSAMFQVAWVVLGLFALTSVASHFGKALVMSLGLRILVDEWRDYVKDKVRLKKWLFWQVKREISNDELKWYIYGMTGLFLWLTLIWV